MFLLSIICHIYKTVIAQKHFHCISVRTCGKPNIQNIMNNVTARPGQTATFKCQVDMSCIVSYIEWYHEMDNGTEKLIKVSLICWSRQLSALICVILLMGLRLRWDINTIIYKHTRISHMPMLNRIIFLLLNVESRLNP